MTDLTQIADTLDPEARNQLFTAMARDSLRSAIKNCTLCPLHQTSIQRVPWEGGPSPVAIIGEAPGANEDRVGRPFVGKAGKILDRILEAVEVPRSAVAIINRICCRPPSNDFALAKSLGAPEACKVWFDAQLNMVQSWLLVVMGNSALSYFSDKPITSMRGKRWWQDGYYIVPTYHPSYINYHPDAMMTVVQDLKVLRPILDGEDRIPVPKNYDPSHAVASLRSDPLTENDRTQFQRHYKKKGYVVFFSQYLGEKIIMSETLDTPVDRDYDSLPRYTVAEVEKLSHWTTKTWEDLRRIHQVKTALGGEVIA